MCRYDRQRAGEDCPQPGDGVCNSPTVGALTASVMAALATLDGIVCRSEIESPGWWLIRAAFLSSSYVQNLADRHGRRPLLIVLPLLATLATSAMIVACKSILISRRDADKQTLCQIQYVNPVRLELILAFGLDLVGIEWSIRVGFDEICFCTYSMCRGCSKRQATVSLVSWT